MICDWSAAAIEYAFGLEKPVLFIDVPRRIRNPGYKELGVEPIEEFVRDRVGAILSPANLQAAPATIERLLTRIDQIQTRIRSMRDEWVFNLGKSAEVAAKEIAKIAEQQAAKKKTT
jgi:YidC/Oxa1 family membrane protein insertase